MGAELFPREVVGVRQAESGGHLSKEEACSCAPAPSGAACDISGQTEPLSHSRAGCREHEGPRRIALPEPLKKAWGLGVRGVSSL